MRRVATRLQHLLKTLAGLGHDEAWSRTHVALYGFLGMCAMALVAAWITGTPLECMAGGACTR